MKKINKTLKAAKVSRRSVLKGAAAAGAVAAIGPWYIPNAFAAPVVNVLMWSEYLPDSVVEKFKEATGITINHTTIGDNDDIIAQMKAGNGKGFDLCSPTNMKGQAWSNLGLLQAYDMNKINTSAVNPGMLSVGERDWNFGSGSCWVPQLWGTESIAWRTDKWSPDGLPSFGDIWEPNGDPELTSNFMMGRTYSMMTGCGIWMHEKGEMDFWSSYESEDNMRKVWDQLTAYCISKKSNLNKFWKGADPQKQGFTSDGVIVGQCWDGPITSMRAAGEPVAYRTTDEGALAWVDGISMSVGAENIDEAYALINFSFTPEIGAETVNTIGYNSAIIGASDLYSQETKDKTAFVYPGETLANLNPWPAEPQWFLDLRAEYANKFQTA